MSTTSTPNIDLVKPTPGTGEYADVSVINDNMDKIDAAVGAVDVQTDGSLQSQITSVRESVTFNQLAKVGCFDMWNGGLQISAYTDSTLQNGYALNFFAGGSIYMYEISNGTATQKWVK